MRANGFYEITNNRFGETFYASKFNSYKEAEIKKVKLEKEIAQTCTYGWKSE